MANDDKWIFPLLSRPVLFYDDLRFPYQNSRALSYIRMEMKSNLTSDQKKRNPQVAI